MKIRLLSVDMVQLNIFNDKTSTIQLGAYMAKTIIHLDKNSQETIKESLPNKKVCSNLANFYSLFSDSTRIKIIISLPSIKHLSPICFLE